MVDVGHGGVIPTIGSKEAVAWIPALLGVRPGDTVLVPEVAYPTYDIGARLAGATPVAVDPTNPDAWPEAALVYLNSPGNPDGHVMSKDELRAVVAWARAHGAVVVSDECYAALPWSEPYVSEGVPSLLDTDVCDGDASGLLVLYSLSKQSNLAGLPRRPHLRRSRTGRPDRQPCASTPDSWCPPPSSTRWLSPCTTPSTWSASAASTPVRSRSPPRGAD